MKPTCLSRDTGVAGATRQVVIRSKGINIYIPKYFVAFKDCINIHVLYGLEVHLYSPVSISANYVTTGNAKMNPSSYLF